MIRGAALGAALLVSMGCGGPETDLLEWGGQFLPDEAPPAPLAHPADCSAALSESGTLIVAGTDTGIGIPNISRGDAVRFWGVEPQKIMVTYRSNWVQQGGARPDGRLWTFRCDDPSQHTLFAREEGADFGSSVASPDGRHLFYTGADGVREIDLRTARTRQITAPPPVDEACWTAAGAEDRPQQRDVVMGLTETPPPGEPQRLIIHRGAPCGFEGDWVAHELHVDPSTDATDLVPPHRPHPVAALARDALGRLWLGDAGRCEEPGVRDPGTHGAVWVSKDEGTTWKRIDVVAGKVRMHTPAETILTDAKRAGHIVVRSKKCKSTAATFGGRVFITRDGGRRWHVASLTEDDALFKIGTPVDAVAMVKDSTDSLLVWAPSGVWRSRDGGDKWSVDSERPLPTPAPPQVTTDQWQFTGGPDGLWREAAGQLAGKGTPKRVFPPARPTEAIHDDILPAGSPVDPGASAPP